MQVSKYSKAIAALGAFIGVLATALSDGTISSTEYGTLFAAAAGVVGVFLVKNKVAPTPPVAAPGAPVAPPASVPPAK